MNLPTSVADTSLLQHEPLRSHIAMHEGSGIRSESKKIVSSFIIAMQEDGQAAVASKAWACLLFGVTPSDGTSLEVADKGEELYKVFFEYQLRLSQGLEQRDIEKAGQYEAQIFQRGISAIRLKDHSLNTQCSARGRGNHARSKGQGDQHPREGDNAMSPSSRCRPHFTTDNTTIQQKKTFDTPPGAGARLSTLSRVAKPRKRSTSKKEKKRKPSSQKPPVITPSDASEDGKEPSKTHEVAAASSMSHRSKRTAPNSSRQPCGLRIRNQSIERNLAHGFDTTHLEGSSSSRPPLALPGLQPDSFISRPNSLNQGKRGAGLSLSHRKRKDEMVLNVNKPFRASFYPKKLGKRRLTSALPTRASKRPCPSLSPLDGESGEAFVSTHNLPAGFLQEPIIQPLVTGPPSSQENEHVKEKARRKRTRPEFEMGTVVSHEDASVDSCESLGPDIRASRPLPRKVHNERLVPDENNAARGVPSLEHADQLLRDVASNALAVLQEGVRPDVPDWTQDRELDADCDDFEGDDQDEADDVQVTPSTSAASVAKPLLPAPPPMWAQSRQEVCESLEHFRSYHSGVYSKDDIVKGYLLGAYAASRDIFHHGGKLIISHGGGKSESVLDPRRGPKRYQTDQDQEASDKSVRALLKTCKDRRPLVLLADDKYALFPYDLTSGNYTYVVLGLYWISHAWAECQSTRDGSGRIVRWKFAFQWCEGQGDPWWTSQHETTDVPKPRPTMPISNMCFTKGSSHPGITGRSSNVECKSCQEHSPFVYQQGWMCLNPLCDMFWTIDGEEPKQLDYREEFLDMLSQRFERLPSITPARVVETPGGVTTTFAFSKGWHCIKCGRLSCRYKWEHWECSNCGFQHVVNGRVRTPKEFWHQRPLKGFLHSRVGKDSGVLACRLEPIDLGAHKGFTNRLTFILPQDRGKIHVILGTPLSNGDADNIFQLYQQQASTGELKLRRYPLRNHRARGQLLTNYFSQNSGEPYQYVGGTGNTVPFHEAPDCVRRALAVIKERSSLALRTDIPFNEVLSAAYMERQKMSFHSDSEKGLGPVVASLSLGSAALMHFRLHANVEDQQGRSTYALTLVLRHGDVLIMEGDGVQKYYEHTVVPMNFRIAATARCIGST